MILLESRILENISRLEHFLFPTLVPMLIHQVFTQATQTTQARHNAVAVSATSTSQTSNMNNNFLETPGVVFAGLAFIIAVLALLVGILQLRNEHQRRQEARQQELELIELEAMIAEVSALSSL
jgi:hypothetical protein